MTPQDDIEPTQRLPLLYASWHRAVPGPFDLGLDFGYLHPEGPQPAVRVVMTWEHAKLLHDLLGQALEQRERNVGEIKLPPGITVGPAPGQNAATSAEEA